LEGECSAKIVQVELLKSQGCVYFQRIGVT